MVANFPDGFVWGAATAAYQIEGAAGEDGRGRSIWDTFSRKDGAVLHGDTGDNAARHYEQMRQDVQLMAELGLRAYRFSVAWPRIQPDGRGPANQAGLDFYRRLVDALLEHGITPFLTLYHWDLPQRLQDEGGWVNRDTAARFADYAELVAGAVGDRVQHWTTLNEPFCSAFLGHAVGIHAPGATDRAGAVRATHHLLLAHGRGMAALRAALPQARVGITLNLEPVRPASPTEEDRDAARRFDGVLNRVFLDPVFGRGYPPDIVEDFAAEGLDLGVQDGDLALIGAPIDFLGVNYYRPQVVRADPSVNGSAPRLPAQEGVGQVLWDGPVTALRWPIDPSGLREILVRLRDAYPAVPLYVTENGAAFHDYVDPEGGVDDLERIAYLDGHLRAVADAVASGVDLRGYFVWSLMDNFEWSEGYSQRFGIVWVDFATGTRLPKASARWYAGVIAANALPENRPGFEVRK